MERDVLVQLGEVSAAGEQAYAGPCTVDVDLRCLAAFLRLAALICKMHSASTSDIADKDAGIA